MGIVTGYVSPGFDAGNMPEDVAKRANQAYRADILKGASDSERLTLIQAIDNMRAMLNHCAEIFWEQSRNHENETRLREFYTKTKEEILEVIKRN